MLHKKKRRIIKFIIKLRPEFGNHLPLLFKPKNHLQLEVAFWLKLSGSIGKSDK